MAKKIFMVVLAMIVLCLCCGICFAAEDNSVSLGNELMQSIDKTGKSMDNVVSGNWVNDVGNSVRNAENDITGMNGKDEGMRNDNRGINGIGDYNTTRTTTEGTTNGMTTTMSTTTWMWIILVVAAIIIIAAIWYYATQNND